MRDTGSLGDKLGPKIAKLVSEAIIATKRGLLPTEHKLRVGATQEIIDRAGREVASLHSVVFDAIRQLKDEDLHPVLDEITSRVASGEHQWEGLAGLGNQVAMGALGSAISNLAWPLIDVINANDRSTPGSPETAAAAVAAQIATYGQGDQVAAAYGLTAGQFEWLVELARNYPGVPDALQMWRRNLLSEAEFVTILHRTGVPDVYVNAWLGLKSVLLTPSDAALAQLRGNLTEAQAAEISAKWGVSGQDHNILVANTGEPPGAAELQEALRRGFIDQATFTKGILESRVRNEWIPTMLKLRYVPMSVADAVNATVQNYMTAGDAAKIADENGLEPGQITTLLETAGEPLSRTELESLYNRGKVTEAQVIQGLRESRLKNKYNDLAFDLHVRLLEPRMLSSAVTAGALTQAQAIQRAMEYGFSEQDATILVKEGVNNKLRTYRERVVSAAEGLYEQNAITQTDFVDIAKSMGFDDSESGFILASAEYRRQEKAMTQVLSAIRSKYVGHHINESQASGYLDAAGIPAAQRDHLLSVWHIEAVANVRTLTPAQIVKAHKLQLISDQDALDRLLAEGYSRTDAALLIEGA